GKPLHTRSIEREHIGKAKELAEAPLVVLQIATIVDAVIDLAVCDQTDRDTVPTKASEEPDGVRSPF
ncbi:MAG: hypothetical protein ACRDI2_10230, partial [Chloroflexota bacterium]